MANFGLIDTSVLYGQANHQSEDVLGDPDTTLTVRRGDISFFRVLQLVPRHIRVLQVLQNMGFLGILQCGHIEIDTHLITALVERWRPETHTFHFSVGEATVTLQDISIIWAIPIEGNLITGVDIRWTTQQWQNYCHQWLGFHPNDNAFKHSRIKLSALLDWLLNNTCDDDSPFDNVLQEARICVMCIIDGILCPGATGNTMSLLYRRHMKIIDEERPSNWGTTVLAYLYRELCMASQRGKTNIGGAMQLLQIWAWSFIITLAPIPSNNAADLMPTVIDLENIIPIPPYAAHITGYRPTDTRDWEYVSLRETCARNRAIGRDMMTFSSARYPNVRGGPAGDEAGPSNVYTPCGPSNVYNEAGPSNVYNEAGPRRNITVWSSASSYRRIMHKFKVNGIPILFPI
ncbi:Serine/threonine-protein phosphatase 7 long form [Sesamum angolense]|uniref:Serine/threonine-protein phosphatase 7 long form n=1 Tax=Sesamum angolense TaxID=2727404 RepID=A0AAE1WI95_9LAMI|nr:Serine/threonine-protein phosphatase 7 long form [Sesamum angolense]